MWMNGKKTANLTPKIREVNTNENSRDAIIEAQWKQAEGEVAVHVANTQSCTTLCLQVLVNISTLLKQPRAKQALEADDRPK